MNVLDLTRFEYCPQCGKHGLRQGSANSVTCPSCDYVYYHSSVAAVVGIIECDDQIIIARRANEPQKGMLALPGGFIEYQENLESGLTRELKEELGLAVTDPRYLASFASRYLFREVLYFTTVAYFIVRASDMTNAKANDDIDEFFLLRPEELGEIEWAFEADRSALTRYRQMKEYAARDGAATKQV